MPRSAVTLALLALAMSAAAKELTWVGCNTNFRNPENWAADSSALPFDSTSSRPPTSVFFAPRADEAFNPVNSFVAEGEYMMHELLLPDNGILTLSADGADFVLFEREETQGEAYFIGGQAERMKDDKCNFRCHKGWVEGYGTRFEAEAQLPPCDGDTAVFPPDNTYRVLAPGIINVDAVRFNGANLPSKFEVPLYQMSPAGEKLHLILNNNANCFAAGVVSGGKCLCHSQCVEEEKHALQDNQLRTLVRDAAAYDLGETRRYTVRLFSYTFDVPLIMGDMGSAHDGSTEFQCLLSSAAGRASAAAALTQDLELMFGGSIVNSITVNYDLGSVTVTGNVSFTRQHTSTINADGSLTSWWAAPTTRTFNVEPQGPNMLAVHLWHTLLTSAGRCELDLAEQALDLLVSSTCPGTLPTSICLAIKTLVLNANSPLHAMTNVVDQIEAYNADSGAFSLDVSGFDAAAEQAVRSAADVIREAMTSGTSTASVLSIGNDIAAAETERRDVEALMASLPTPRLTRASHSATFMVGTLLPQSDVNRLVDARNYAKLAKYIANRLPGTPPVLFIDDAHVSMEVKNHQYGERRRRESNRIGSGQAVWPLFVTLSYDMLTRAGCVSGDTRAHCPLFTGSGPHSVVEATLDDLIAMYDIVTASCYDLSSGNNFDCGVTQARLMMSANKHLGSTALAEMVKDMLRTVFDCASGLCEEDPEGQAALEALVEDVYAAASQQQGSTSASATPVPAVAGGAGALVVVVVIIVLVVARRRRRSVGSSAKKGGAGDRTVVAFENPMYDDPTQPSHAVYDETGGVGDEEAEGLYDQPAFSQLQDKENPLYQSTENIAGGEPDGVGDEGGYLDVAGENENQDEDE